MSHETYAKHNTIGKNQTTKGHGYLFACKYELIIEGYNR